jgi:hypothetical protein
MLSASNTFSHPPFEIPLSNSSSPAFSTESTPSIRSEDLSHHFDLLNSPTPSEQPLVSTVPNPHFVPTTAPLVRIPTQQTSSAQDSGPSPQPIRKPGPGRPSKAELAARISPETRRSLITKSRKLHNVSASKSRARFSAVLDDLWNEVPSRERSRGGEFAMFGPRQVSRGEKVEIAIMYIRKLQMELER